MTAQCGTFHWMAPEVIAGHRSVCVLRLFACSEGVSLACFVAFLCLTNTSLLRYLL